MYPFFIVRLMLSSLIVFGIAALSADCPIGPTGPAGAGSSTGPTGPQGPSGITGPSLQGLPGIDPNTDVVSFPCQTALTFGRIPLPLVGVTVGGGPNFTYSATPTSLTLTFSAPLTDQAIVVATAETVATVILNVDRVPGTVTINAVDFGGNPFHPDFINFLAFECMTPV